MENKEHIKKYHYIYHTRQRILFPLKYLIELREQMCSGETWFLMMNSINVFGVLFAPIDI